MTKYALGTALFGLALSAGASVTDRPVFRADNLVVVWAGGDFAENEGEAPIAFDFVLLDGPSGTQGSDLIAGDGVTVVPPFNSNSDGTRGGWPFEITGQTFGGQFNNVPSTQLLDPGDSYTAFGLDADTDVGLLGNGQRFSYFLVASNAPFDIYAQVSNFQATGDFTGLGLSNIAYQFRELSPTSASIGQASQSPGVGGQGIVVGRQGAGDGLDDIGGGPTKVFDGGQRTAARPGTLAQQSAGFLSIYNLRGSPITGDTYDFSMGTGTLSADVTYTVYVP